MKLVEGESLRKRLAADPPLVEDFVDTETQIQMNGVDFTLREVSRFGDEAGAIDFDNSERKTPETIPIEPDGDGWWTLGLGPYWVVYNEVVNIRLICSRWPEPVRACSEVAPTLLLLCGIPGTRVGAARFWSCTTRGVASEA